MVKQQVKTELLIQHLDYNRQKKLRAFYKHSVSNTEPLSEAEGILQALQESLEKGEQVWRAKLTVSEEEFQRSQV